MSELGAFSEIVRQKCIQTVTKGGGRMVKHGKNLPKNSGSKPFRPALTPDARESQMLSLAMDLVEQRLRDGSASSAETTHFLKLASSRERLEMELMEQQKQLLAAKKENLESTKRIEELYGDAMKAMRSYSGDQSSQMDIFGADIKSHD